MATFDEIQLQKLLAPFENNRGIVSTNNAVPMLNSIPMIDTFSIYQNNQVPLVDQIIAENQSLVNTTPIDFINAPQDYYPTTGIVDSTPARNMISDPSNLLPQVSAFLPSRFQGVSDLGRDDEDVEQVEYLGSEPSGIKKLLNFIQNTFQKLPTPSNRS